MEMDNKEMSFMITALSIMMGFIGGIAIAALIVAVF